jgi:RNA polymerase sigma factor (sigma-70 family)
VESWLSELHQGHVQAAWDLFAERYRRLILATIRRLVPDHDDVMDVYATVCESLSADDCARLRRYSEHAADDAPGARQASVATWLVVVVRNLTTDWRRHRDGRRRIAVPAGLSPLQQRIHAAICGGGCSHVEAYEVVRAGTDPWMPFEEFLREVRTTLRVAPCAGDARRHAAAPSPLRDDMASDAGDPTEAAELARRIAAALASCPDDVRVAVELFVVEGLPADQVARVVGWPNAKTVYNRVYRALASMRADFVRHGIGPADL